MRVAHILNASLVVCHEFAKHVAWQDKVFVVVTHALKLGDVADRPDGGAADLAHSLGENIDAGFNLLGLLIKEKVIAAEMRSADVPMEILGFHIQRERISKQRVE